MKVLAIGAACAAFLMPIALAAWARWGCRPVSRLLAGPKLVDLIDPSKIETPPPEQYAGDWVQRGVFGLFN